MTDAERQEQERAVAFLTERQRAYRQCFGSPAGQMVLADLIRFCRGNESEWSDDARHHARYSGRREVHLRIQQHLTEPIEKLFERYADKPYVEQEEPKND